jgi:DNA-binding HxlR family transcriptional regulator
VRSYGQYCGLARALDVVGERWVLLIVRELLEEPRRYNELLDGLPGIATNLLADRLKSMEESGVLQRREEGRYALSPWGEELHEAVFALGRWAGPLMAQPRGDDEFRPNWMRHMVIARFEGVDARRRDLVVELRCVDEPLTLISAAGRVHLARGRATDPDVVLAGTPEPVVALLLGRITRAEAESRGVETKGDVRRLRGLHPRGEGRSGVAPPHAVP